MELVRSGSFQEGGSQFLNGLEDLHQTKDQKVMGTKYPKFCGSSKLKIVYYSHAYIKHIFFNLITEARYSFLKINFFYHEIILSNKIY